MIVKYNPKLKELARQLRNNATKSEIRLWQKLKRNQMYGYDLHRQKPIDEFIAQANEVHDFKYDYFGCCRC